MFRKISRFREQFFFTVILIGRKNPSKEACFQHLCSISFERYFVQKHLEVSPSLNKIKQFTSEFLEAFLCQCVLRIWGKGGGGRRIVRSLNFFDHEVFFTDCCSDFMACTFYKWNALFKMFY